MKETYERRYFMEDKKFNKGIIVVIVAAIAGIVFMITRVVGNKD